MRLCARNLAPVLLSAHADLGIFLLSVVPSALVSAWLSLAIFGSAIKAGIVSGCIVRGDSFRPGRAGG